MMYGNPQVNIDAFVDQVLIETLKKTISNYSIFLSNKHFYRPLHPLE